MECFPATPTTSSTTSMPVNKLYHMVFLFTFFPIKYILIVNNIQYHWQNRHLNRQNRHNNKATAIKKDL